MRNNMDKLKMAALNESRFITSSVEAPVPHPACHLSIEPGAVIKVAMCSVFMVSHIFGRIAAKPETRSARYMRATCDEPI
jgi:hypothetical protein